MCFPENQISLEYTCTKKKWNKKVTIGEIQHASKLIKPSAKVEIKKWYLNQKVVQNKVGLQPGGCKGPRL